MSFVVFLAKHARVPSLWRNISPGKKFITDHHDQPWRCLSVDHYKPHTHPRWRPTPPLWTDTTSLMRPLHLKIYITHYIQHHLTTSLYNIHRIMQLLHLNRFINSSFTEWSSAAPQPSSSQSFSWLCSSSSSMSPITAPCSVLPPYHHPLCHPHLHPHPAGSIHHGAQRAFSAGLVITGRSPKPYWETHNPLGHRAHPSRAMQRTHLTIRALH